MQKLTPESRRHGVAVLALLLASAPAWGAPGAGSSSSQLVQAPGRPAAKPATQGTSQSPGRPDVASALLTEAKGGTLSDSTAASLLLAAGPAETAALFTWFQASKHDEAALAPVERARLEPALRGTPTVIVRIALLPQLSAADRHHALKVALEAIIGVGSAASSQDLTSLLQGVGKTPYAATLRAQVTDAVARLVDQPHVTSTEVSTWLAASGPALSTAVVDGVDQAKAVMVLVDCLSQSTGAEGALLNRTAGLIQRGVPVAPELTARVTVPFLQSHNAFERAEASTILGLVGDRRHVGKLVAGLDDAEHMVRTNTLKALKNLTGMTISGNADRWKRWHADQEQWWDDKGGALVDSLRSAGRHEIMAILKQVSTRRLYRKEISEQLVPMLRRSDADQVQVAVASLATLRDPSTLAEILKLRNHSDPRVRSSVEDAVVAFRHSGIKESRVKTLPGH